jgi:hypothetical protein
MVETLLAAILQIAGPDSVFQEMDGLLVIEVESAPVAGKWVKETSLSGFTGSAYYTWKGPDLSGPSDKSALAYRFQVTAAGRYHLRIHNRHDHSDSTLENDCYTRMDDGPWVKTFSSERGRWTWRTSHEHSYSDKRAAEYALSAGSHTLTVTGRSINFSIDRIHLYRDGLRGAEDLSKLPSPTLFEATAGPGPYVKLASLADRVRSGRGFGEVLKILRDKKGSPDAQEAREAQAMIEAIEKAGQRAIDAARSHKDPVEAVRLFDQTAAQFAGDAIGTKAAEEGRTLRQDPQVQREIKAEASWKKVEDLKGQIKPHNGSHDPKSEGYRRRNQAAVQVLLGTCQSLAKNHPGTAAAARAEAILQDYR